MLSSFCVIQLTNRETKADRNIASLAGIKSSDIPVFEIILVLVFTSCRRAAATICPAPLLPLWAPKRLAPPSTPQRSSSFSRTFPRWPLQLPYALRPRWVKRPGDLDLWPFDLESGVRVACDVGYLCANFGLPRPLFSRLRPDVRDRQTSDRQTWDVRKSIA